MDGRHQPSFPEKNYSFLRAFKKSKAQILKSKWPVIKLQQLFKESMFSFS